MFCLTKRAFEDGKSLPRDVYETVSRLCLCLSWRDEVEVDDDSVDVLLALDEDVLLEEGNDELVLVLKVVVEDVLLDVLDVEVLPVRDEEVLVNVVDDEPVLALEVLVEEVLLDALDVEVLDVDVLLALVLELVVDEVEVEDDDIDVLLVLDEDVFVEKVDDEVFTCFESLKAGQMAARIAPRSSNSSCFISPQSEAEHEELLGRR
eukprot:s1590_g30.t1